MSSYPELSGPSLTSARALRIFKLILLVLLTAAATTLVLQNTEATDVRVLFWTVRVSRIVLFALPMALGFAAGFVAATLWRRRT